MQHRGLVAVAGQGSEAVSVGAQDVGEQVRAAPAVARFAR
jgi:hypothetical protein